MLTLLLPLLDLVAVGALIALLSRTARASEGPLVPTPDPLFLLHQPDHYAAVDLLVFSQFDSGSDPFVDEGFRYEAISGDLRLHPSERMTLRGTAVVAYLQNDPLKVLPASIANAHVTSASTDFVTLDASLAGDFLSPDGTWTFSPGFFYHHQWAYLAGGLDLDVRHILAGGDSVVRLAFSGRYASLRQLHWDGTESDGDHRITNNFIFGWTQVLSPTLVTNLGLQYTNQTGLLYSTLQFVGLYDRAGVPVLLVDENLPRERNRGQINLRGRYTPFVGMSYGLDLSGYYDDWDLLNVAVEPSVEFPIVYGARLRLWYRVVDQKGTKFFVVRPETAQLYMTQNSNLGSFLMQSPGAVVNVPLGEPLAGSKWMLRASVLGFYRSDRMAGVGGSLGVSVEW